MQRVFGATSMVLVLTLACSKQSASDGGGQTTTTQAATESGDPSDTSDTSETESSDTEASETDTDEESGFVPDYDGGGLCSLDRLSVCDEVAQDCPEDEKCVPFHIEDCSYPRCISLIGDKQAGEPCSVDEMGYDDCDANSWCYPGTFDRDRPAVCIPFCKGPYDDLACDDPSLVCVLDNFIYQGVFGCRPGCDPLMPEGCEPWERCTFGLGDQPDFGCMPAGSVAEGEVCKTNQDCDSGMCVAAESLLDCAGASCCSPWCDLMAPSCAIGLECVPVDVGGPNSTVGVCILP